MDSDRRSFSRLFVTLSLTVATLAVPSAAQHGSKPTPTAPARPRPVASTPAPSKPAGKATSTPKLAPRGAPSADDENAHGESDPRFDVRSLAKSHAKPVASAASNMLRLADHEKRAELAHWIEDAIRGREIDVALLGGHKYMINDCLGVKASAGKFKLKLDNPAVHFENTGLVMKFSISRVSISAIKIRMRPNPNVLEPCKFSDKFEVGGAMEDVKLTLRMDPLYDLERCRIGAWGDANPEVRIGNLNLKPLQNDLDRMAKNMIEDALTMSLQMSIDGFASAMGDMVFAAIDDFLEADCPTKAGDTARTVDGAGRRLGGAAGSSGGAASNSDSASTPDTAPSANVADLLARIDALEARVIELENRETVPTDLESALELALAHIAALDAPAQSSPQLQALLASVLALAIDRSGIADRHEAFEQVLRMCADLQPPNAEPPGANGAAFTITPNAQLKGRMGRVVVAFPDTKLASETYVAIERDGQKIDGHYGEMTAELLPGNYVIRVTGVAVPCEVRSGHDTKLRVGMFQIEASKETYSSILAAQGEEKLHGKYGAYTIGLPVGRYAIELAGQREAIEIRDGEVAKF